MLVRPSLFIRPLPSALHLRGVSVHQMLWLRPSFIESMGESWGSHVIISLPGALHLRSISIHQTLLRARRIPRHAAVREAGSSEQSFLE